MSPLISERTRAGLGFPRVSGDEPDCDVPTVNEA